MDMIVLKKLYEREKQLLEEKVKEIAELEQVKESEKALQGKLSDYKVTNTELAVNF